MEVTLLIRTIFGLIIILAILIFLLFLSYTNKKKKIRLQKARSLSKTKTVEDTSLEYLKNIIKNKNSTASELKSALDLVLKHHGTIKDKIGERTHEDFDIYMNILFTICRHPNTNKDILLNFERSLTKLNPKYKKDIGEATTRGLNSRRV
ncbi:MAG: hypothetical protein JJW00_09955 [Sulfurimonas sp.]|nr:hypothetical protein [Sulfurimonas sp.]